ncbi:M23 family metallopeptidase [Sphingosinicella sp. YJ22]|uniref:M23 family metallopeptidase n=1 Tax=Sphingosinicella sp. YJ22 TaxID=1104780 RepID=UPI001FB01DAB|nr:M23 family metallopeptidase [Sphingosinicella sp. YJ22]
MRRFTVGRRAQAAATGAVLGLLAWSGYATVQYASAMTSDVATMQRQVADMQQDVEALRTAAAERAEVVEQRQAFLSAMLSGQADPADVARLLPAAVDGDIEDPRIAAEFEQIEGMQLSLAAQADAATRARYRQTAAAVRRLGIDPRRLAQGGVGGPFEEAAGGATPANADVDPRFAQLFASWRQMEQLEQGVASIPSMMPVQGARWTSSFGVRSDPFRGRAAMHGGIDMAGPIGTPIYATADGTVATAAWNSGGYGNLVELGHGAGIATRYGHLSRIMVRDGERVRRGQVIGLMGSTGRSTGSHLHYEVRIDGRAVNPLPFLQSGQALAALQSSSGGRGGSR